MKLQIRPVRKKDIPLLDQQLGFGYRGKHAKRYEMQRTGQSTYLIAWEANGPVGHGLVKWNPQHEHAALKPLNVEACPDLEDLLVHPNLRGRGIGTAILKRALMVARRRGCKRIGLSVGESDNPRARALYERIGFSDAGLGPIKMGGAYTDKDGKACRWEEICIYLIKPL